MRDFVENDMVRRALPNKALAIELNPKSDNALLHAINETIICTDGTTLLGADDKAGIAIIMALLEVLHENPSIKP